MVVDSTIDYRKAVTTKFLTFFGYNIAVTAVK